MYKTILSECCQWLQVLQLLCQLFYTHTLCVINLCVCVCVVCVCLCVCLCVCVCVCEAVVLSAQVRRSMNNCLTHLLRSYYNICVHSHIIHSTAYTNMHTNMHTHKCIPYSGKFSRGPICAVFAVDWQTTKIKPAK